MSKVALSGNVLGTGTVTLASPNTNSTVTLNLPATAGTVLIQDGTNTTTVVNLTATGTVNVGGGNISPQTGFKNRIINGAMTIDQRNAGAAVTNTGGITVYGVDRFAADNGTDAVYTVQQVTDAPSGFISSAKVTVTTADASIGASQTSSFLQAIEGYNLADLGWGTASAQTVTMSFWVKSSLTGTFGGALRGAASTRSYPFTYTISAANTWEQKVITIVGETTGTWNNTNGVGVQVLFGLAVGSTFSGTPGAWASASLRSATGATNILSTLSATWYITGVQLERGSVATPFEFRSIGTETELCQRYYQKSAATNVVPANGGTSLMTIGNAWGTSFVRAAWISFPVVMRASPTITFFRGTETSTDGQWASYDGSVWTAATATTAVNLSSFGMTVDLNRTSAFTTRDSYLAAGLYAITAEL